MKRKSRYPQVCNSQALVHCPTADKPVIANDWKDISIPGEQTTWWHCPACQGWHVLQMSSQQQANDHTSPDT